MKAVMQTDETIQKLGLQLMRKVCVRRAVTVTKVCSNLIIKACLFDRACLPTFLLSSVHNFGWCNSNPSMSTGLNLPLRAFTMYGFRPSLTYIFSSLRIPHELMLEDQALGHKHAERGSGFLHEPIHMRHQISYDFISYIWSKLLFLYSFHYRWTPFIRNRKVKGIEL